MSGFYGTGKLRNHDHSPAVEGAQLTIKKINFHIDFERGHSRASMKCGIDFERGHSSVSMNVVVFVLFLSISFFRICRWRHRGIAFVTRVMNVRQMTDNQAHSSLAQSPPSSAQSPPSAAQSPPSAAQSPPSGGGAPGARVFDFFTAADFLPFFTFTAALATSRDRSQSLPASVL